MFRQVYSFLFLFSISCLCITIINCGLFSPDEAENPEIGGGEVDPLNFKSILDNTVEQFDFQDYDDLFHNNLEYIHTVPHTEIFYKKEVLNRLDYIKEKKVNIEWFSVDTLANDPPFNTEDTVTLQPRAYEIVVIDSVRGNTEYSSNYNGEATFKLIFDNQMQAWLIYIWKDKNTTIGVEKSYFHPLF